MQAHGSEGRYYSCMLWWMRGVVALWVLLTAATSVAQMESIDEAPPESATEEFGPVIVIEDIEVVGNDTTATRLIRRVLPIAKGDAIRAGDRRLVEARYKVLALGYFRDVAL